MGRLIVTSFTTLDGVVEDPAGSDGTPFGGWAMRHGPQGVAGDKFRLGPILEHGTLLFGRHTWDHFRTLWPHRDDPFSQAMNAATKAVRETGLVLLDRSRRGGQRSLTLTAAGRCLAEHAARLAAVLADAEADALALTGRLEGPVRIGAFPTAVQRLVVPAVLVLARTDPGVTPVVHELDEAAGIAALHAGDLDVVLVEDESARRRPPPPGLTARRLLDDPYRLALPTGWPRPRDITDLAQRPWVDGPPGSAVRAVLDRLRATTRLPLPVVHTCLEFPAALALVDAGLAAALVPALALPELPGPGTRLVDVPGLGARTISIWTQTTRRPARLLTTVLDALATTAPNWPEQSH